MGARRAARRALKELNLGTVLAWLGGDSHLGLGQGEGGVLLGAGGRWCSVSCLRCVQVARRKAPAAFYLCWTTGRDSAPGAPEGNLEITAGVHGFLMDS